MCILKITLAKETLLHGNRFLFCDASTDDVLKLLQKEANVTYRFFLPT